MSGRQRDRQMVFVVYGGYYMSGVLTCAIVSSRLSEQRVFYEKKW